MQSDDHIYSPQNRRLYFNPENPPESRTVLSLILIRRSLTV